MHHAIYYIILNIVFEIFSFCSIQIINCCAVLYHMTLPQFNFPLQDWWLCGWSLTKDAPVHTLHGSPSMSRSLYSAVEDVQAEDGAALHGSRSRASPGKSHRGQLSLGLLENVGILLWVGGGWGRDAKFSTVHQSPEWQRHVLHKIPRALPLRNIADYCLQ